jgi:hypothetical protein
MGQKLMASPFSLQLAIGDKPPSSSSARRTVKSALPHGLSYICAIQVLELRNFERRLYVGRKPRHHDDWDPSSMARARA